MCAVPVALVAVRGDLERTLGDHTVQHAGVGGGARLRPAHERRVGQNAPRRPTAHDSSRVSIHSDAETPRPTSSVA